MKKSSLITFLYEEAIVEDFFKRTVVDDFLIRRDSYFFHEKVIEGDDFFKYTNLFSILMVYH